jgi:hypothetical protein
LPFLSLPLTQGISLVPQEVRQIQGKSPSLHQKQHSLPPFTKISFLKLKFPHTMVLFSFLGLHTFPRPKEAMILWARLGTFWVIGVNNGRIFFSFICKHGVCLLCCDLFLFLFFYYSYVHTILGSFLTPALV